MEYMKSWPELMSGKKILYVHGFASSGLSGTVTLLRTIFPNATVIAPDLPLRPQEAMELLRNVCVEELPDLIIGSSMGGMMTEMLYGYDRILVNPAFRMGETMGSHGMVGKLTFQNPRRDGVQEMIVTKALVKEYRELTAQCFDAERVREDNGRVWGLFGDKDPVVHTKDLFLEHYTQGVTFHGEHRLIDKVVHHALVPLVRWIDDRQEKRQRETIYIDFECLHDSYMQATSSMRKAIETLIDRYELHFVAPSPTNDTSYYNMVTEWLREYVTVPAHGHVTFTNRPDLLYGDFFISPCPPEGGMATPVEYGSDTFKTWEEIITYFDRLTN
ncbi:MAG: esterase [Bacteroidales bacterium]|nr:esterase [Bacteroidales bacterium]MCM1146839.1 esterase [Bacteroidales bacterium]MCM1205663.1 esterase [Bacillota bacterium]MCM1510225.1 hypothetical protein [Clostridium sp.]